MKQVYRFTLVFLSLFMANGLLASADTVTVRAHDATDLTWYGAYVDWATFPDASQSFAEIHMDLTVGCSSNGCSDWDYDVDVEVGRPTGRFDSTIASIDTLSTSPLVLDTSYNAPFEVIEWYELGRMITPYGTYMANGSNGFSNAWTHRYQYDVTDYRPLLTDSVPIRVFYHGWSDGFSATVDFHMVEGQPAREVVGVHSVFSGGTYNNSAQFEALLGDTSIAVPADAQDAELKVIVTGHGQYGEFTPVSYSVKAEGNLVREEEIWRDDCGMLPLYPQGGTWIFNRANWCPGDAVEVHRFPLKDYLNGSTLDLDMDFDAFTPTDDASYSITGLLFFYKEHRRQNDVAIHRIIAPSTDENATRFNPICSEPIIEIENRGHEALTYCQFRYGVEGGTPSTLEWSGSLAPDEIERIHLPAFNWAGFDASNPQFYVEALWPNAFIDQFPYNNRKQVGFDIPPVYDTENIQVRFRTNDHPEENAYYLVNAAGDTLLEETSFTASQTQEEVVFLLDPGCYTFTMTDYDNMWGGGDGISWWFNQRQGLETAGFVELRDALTPDLYIRFDGDFGSQLHHSFLLEDSLHELPSVPVTPLPEMPEVDTVEFNGDTYWQINDSIWVNQVGIYRRESVINNIEESPLQKVEWSIQPNPSNGRIKVELTPLAEETTLSIYTLQGQFIQQQVIPRQAQSAELDLGNLAAGTYFVYWNRPSHAAQAKVLVVK